MGLKAPKPYTLGFLFSEDMKHVALIKKTKPVWQKDRLNGIGGKLEEGETPLECMIREFREETGMQVDKWDHFATMYNQDFVVYCYMGYGDVWKLETVTEEEVIVISPDEISEFPSLYNLKWLIPLAVDKEVVKPTMFQYPFQEKYVEPVLQKENESKSN